MLPPELNACFKMFKFGFSVDDATEPNNNDNNTESIQQSKLQALEVKAEDGVKVSQYELFYAISNH